MRLPGGRRPVTAGLVGLVAGLLSAVLFVGSGVLISVFISDRTALAVVGSVAGMGGLVLLAAVVLSAGSWYGLPAVPLAIALFFCAELAFSSAVLDARGVHVTAVISEVRTVTAQPSGTEGHACYVRLPDGTTAELTGYRCDEGTRVGTRVGMIQDPEGLVDPLRSVALTARQFGLTEAALAAGLVATTTAALVHGALQRRRVGDGRRDGPARPGAAA